VKIEGFASKTTKTGGYLVTVDGKELPLKPSQKLRNHSPTGFCWGYSGSGPAQLALALLLHAGVSKEDALDLYQDFKARHISGLPNGKDFVVELDIQAWVLGIKSARAALGRKERKQ
jgi:hypothetical protein